MSRAPHALLFLATLLWCAAPATAQQCSRCDCDHFPIPSTCGKCCGVSLGRVTSITRSSLTVSEGAGSKRVSKTFAVTPSTKKTGAPKRGSQVTVYYRKSGSTAARVDVVSALKGLLVPGDQKDPPAPSGCGPIPPSAMRAYLGSSLAWYEKDEFTVLALGGEAVLRLRRTANGVAAYAKVMSKDGKLIAEVVDNRFYVNPSNSFRIERPDAHTLEVDGPKGELALRIEYLNPHSFSVLGTLSGPSGLRISVTPTDMVLPYDNVLRRMCLGNDARAIGVGRP